jgi:hypothetical protein
MGSIARIRRRPLAAFPRPPRSPEERQPLRRFPGRAPLRRPHPLRRRVPPAGHAERPLPPAWRPQHGTAHARRTRPLPPLPLEAQARSAQVRILLREAGLQSRRTRALRARLTGSSAGHGVHRSKSNSAVGARCARLSSSTGTPSSTALCVNDPRALAARGSIQRRRLRWAWAPSSGFDARPLRRHPLPPASLCDQTCFPRWAWGPSLVSRSPARIGLVQRHPPCAKVARPNEAMTGARRRWRA